MEGSFTDARVHQWLQEIADESYISLHYDTPALSDATFAEIFGGGYTRQRVNWAQPTNRSIWSLEAVRFSGLVQNQLTHFGVWNALTGGELIAYARLPEMVILLSGQGHVFPAGELALSIG